MIKILVIDDEESICWITKKMLEDLGKYRVSFATSGKSGLKAAKSESPDLILLDIEMDDMSGLDLLKVLRKKRKTKDIPVIMVTGVDAPEAMEEASYDYAEQYLLKPIKVEELDEAIERALSYQSL